MNSRSDRVDGQSEAVHLLEAVPFCARYTSENGYCEKSNSKVVVACGNRKTIHDRNFLTTKQFHFFDDNKVM